MSQGFLTRFKRLDQRDWEEALAMVPPELRDHLKLLPAKAWRLIQIAADGVAVKSGDLCVITSWAIEADGRRWWHVSMSRSDRKMPTYQDMCAVKEALIGADKKAIQVFAPEAVHVNIHPACLHLWHCLDADPLPEFSGIVAGVRTI